MFARACIVLTAILCASASGFAQPTSPQSSVTTQPPSPAQKATAAPAKVERRFMLNAKIAGTAFFDPGMALLPIQPQLSIEPAVAVSPNGHGYLFIPLALHKIGWNFSPSIGLGYQQDVPLPVRNLYLTGRGSLAYERTRIYLDNSTDTPDLVEVSSALLTAEFGIKYTPGGIVNLGLDFLSWQARFSDRSFMLTQRLVLTAGLNF